MDLKSRVKKFVFKSVRGGAMTDVWGGGMTNEAASKSLVVVVAGVAACQALR
eukprot:SAG11_NODE_267_length_11457_cov_14.773728_5_plen_52_part_00